MTTYALITRDLTDTGSRKQNITPEAPENLHPAKPYWVPIEEEITDTSTGPDKVTGAWFETVEVTRLLRAQAIRDKTAGEIDAEDDTRADNLLNQKGASRALARVAFDQENRIRALESQPSVSAAQFKDILKSLMR